MTEKRAMEKVQSFIKNFKTIDAVFYSYRIKDTPDLKDFFVTDNTENIFGYAQLEFDINLWKKAIHPLDKIKVYRRKKQMHLKLESGIIQHRIIHRDGSVRWVEDHLAIEIGDDGSSNVFFGLIIDVTTKKKREQQIEHMAFYDTLTGLPNRNMLSNYTPKAIARCKRKNTELAIMYLDLNKFKYVNDTLGHEIGDILLKQVAQRLTECVRDGDIVSRQGGDEFVILFRRH